MSTQIKKRGRPRKDRSSQSLEIKGCGYWSGDGQVFFADGWAWGTELVEKDPELPALKAREARPICLGREEDILLILKGERPIPQEMHPRRRAVLDTTYRLLEVRWFQSRRERR